MWKIQKRLKYLGLLSCILIASGLVIFFKNSSNEKLAERDWLTQQFGRTLWLYEVASARSLEASRPLDNIRLSYAGFVFQTFLISKNQPELLGDRPVINKFMAASPMTTALLESQLLDDPLNIMIWYDSNGLLQWSGDPNIGIYIDTELLKTKDKYIALGRECETWLRGLK